MKSLLTFIVNKLWISQKKAPLERGSSLPAGAGFSSSWAKCSARHPPAAHCTGPTPDLRPPSRRRPGRPPWRTTRGRLGECAGPAMLWAQGLAGQRSGHLSTGNAQIGLSGAVPIRPGGGVREYRLSDGKRPSPDGGRHFGC